MAEPTQLTDFDLIFSHRHSRIPEDTVFYTIFPESAVSYSASSSSSSAVAAIVSRHFHSLAAQNWDNNGDFLLIEATFHLPYWLNPDTNLNHVFVHRGEVHIVPRDRLPKPSLVDSLKFLINCESESRASSRFKQLSSDRDFLKSQAKYAFRLCMLTYAREISAPKCYPMPSRGDGVSEYLEAELGMKIACMFEMMYQRKEKERVEGKGSTWVNYKESLERNGYFEGLLPISEEYNRRMENVEECYRKSVLFSRTSDMLSALIRRIDEILALPYLVEDFRDNEVPPFDDDSWLYHGEAELNFKTKVTQDAGPSSSSSKNLDDFDFGHVAKSMQSFVDKVNMNKVELDADRFRKDNIYFFIDSQTVNWLFKKALLRKALLTKVTINCLRNLHVTKRNNRGSCF
ncbi:hypothetical protein K2173_003349 [Erythroxylum novogranatense]|uniref:Uncharacterized protein n=1 Tax=Erythroxylum novogranatense TaxID=1862640 RepID=A0AAV8S8S1_9ROSI|nr:hypothetical protein K2173_003349 [Erythroxylum novogranatense]